MARNLRVPFALILTASTIAMVGLVDLTGAPSAAAAVSNVGGSCGFHLGVPIENGAAGTLGFEVPVYPADVHQSCSTTVTAAASIAPLSGGSFTNVEGDPGAESVTLSFSGGPLPFGIIWIWRPDCADPASSGLFTMTADGQTSPGASIGPATCYPDRGDISSLSFDGVDSVDPYVMVGIASTSEGNGYWTVPASGSTVLSAGGATVSGFLPFTSTPAVGVVADPDGHGYWVVGADGGVFAFAGAPFYGSMGGKHLNAPVVGMAPTGNGGGYWLVAADGGVFSFGNARFGGSMANKHLAAPVVGIGSTGDDQAYRLVAADGGVFSFGGARFGGSMGGKKLDAPIVGIASSGLDGYWITAADGGVFSFGGAKFWGSAASLNLAAPVTAIAASPSDDGYWLLGADGGVFAYGHAKYYGATPLQ